MANVQLNSLTCTIKHWSHCTLLGIPFQAFLGLTYSFEISLHLFSNRMWPTWRYCQNTCHLKCPFLVKHEMTLGIGRLQCDGVACKTEKHIFEECNVLRHGVVYFFLLSVLYLYV
ncbi:hypothetical protein CEXT_493621 [Caerostris extrusa]|uniref:Uncharacterized protein n=1 Tax=Caerostris extrusa TaxID=172846 RepID=A0AAV4SDP2_CAEEX|nr:hypothetical protein CEXT_493621 [Caerostris extrusa]